MGRCCVCARPMGMAGSPRWRAWSCHHLFLVHGVCDAPDGCATAKRAHPDHIVGAGCIVENGVVGCGGGQEAEEKAEGKGEKGMDQISTETADWFSSPATSSNTFVKMRKQLYYWHARGSPKRVTETRYEISVNECAALDVSDSQPR